jgi:hypothetical protein
MTHFKFAVKMTKKRWKKISKKSRKAANNCLNIVVVVVKIPEK